MTILKQKTVKTGKPHNCHGCTKGFPVGTEMVYNVAVDQGEFSHAYWCDACETIMDQLDNWECEDGIYFGEFNDSWYDQYRVEE